MSSVQDGSRNVVCRPIHSLNELYTLMENPPSWPQFILPISKRSGVVKNCDLYKDDLLCHFLGLDVTSPARFKYGTLPKTLVCHDMKGGYIDDSPIEGTSNFEAYTFYNWAGIDIFVYFSHHFITIPPLGWINIAHQHGVQILGTIITESGEGIQLCDEFLESDYTVDKFVHYLVVTARYFKMDGWLLNIENPVKKPELLLKFVQNLTAKMHQELPGSLVIWYDSVTMDGQLSWQNCLNHRNQAYFDACDGIFTNYSWSRSHLEVCRREAGARRHDVYIGVDVWGRNFWGGGCFNTADAVQNIFKFGLSLAIFGQAWTHEAISIRDAFHQQDLTHQMQAESCYSKMASVEEHSRRLEYFKKCATRDNFMLRDTALWNTIWPYLNTRGPKELPFKTTFCIGSGDRKCLDGGNAEKLSWFNMRDQSYQLTTPLCGNAFILKELANTVERKRKPSKSANENRKDDQSSAEENTDETDNDSDEKSKNNTSDNAKKSKCKNDEICDTNVEGECETRDEVERHKKIPIVRYEVKPNFENDVCISVHFEDSFSGGSCRKISPILRKNQGDANVRAYVRLFICEFMCDSNFVIYYVVKKLNDDKQDLNVILKLRNNRTKCVFNVVLSGAVAYPGSVHHKEVVYRPINVESDVEFKDLQKNLLENHPGFYVPVGNNNNWDVRYYNIDVPNHTIIEIGCELSMATGSILLGGLGVTRDVVSF